MAAAIIAGDRAPRTTTANSPIALIGFAMLRAASPRTPPVPHLVRCEIVKLELRGITKRFPGFIANESVDLNVQPGEILGLLGEERRGQDDAHERQYGLYQADEGQILLDDRP